MNRLTAAIAATALAVTGSVSTPASAGSDRDKALILLLGAAALGYALHESGKHKDRPPAIPASQNRRMIPQACVFDIHARDGRRDVVSERCVTELTPIRSLPRDCAFEIRTNWGNKTVYGTQCLQDFGYRIEGSRRW